MAARFDYAQAEELREVFSRRFREYWIKQRR
jgi:hypothetical protein